MKKLLFVLFAILLISVTPLFAGGSSEAISEESWVLEHSSVNNDNKYWDVTEKIDAKTPEQEYSAAPIKGTELLRIRTNYGRNHTGDKYRKVTIEPVGGGWEFISDNNATVTRAYSFALYKIGWTRSGSNDPATKSGSPTEVTTGITSDSTEYSFTMSSATWDSGGWLSKTWYTSKFYDYELVLVLPELTPAERSRLEPGDYHATFKVTLYLGSSNGGSSTSQLYTIKAVYGESSSGATEYSFTVSEANSTYDVNLSSTTRYFDVAAISFHAVGLSNSTSSFDTTVESQNSGKYKVLISPYSKYDLDDTSDDNPYMFILNGTDNNPRTDINTVWYTLASNSSGASLALYDSSKYKHTYVLTPSVDATGKARNWVLKWDLDQDIYIKPLAPTTAVTQANGTYHTTLYFYVVTIT